MTTQYSTSLRLALIGDGDQAGTWGDTTNYNFGTLVEEALTGVVAISLTGLTTYTLKSYNGTYDDARSMVLIFAGSPTATVTITAPLVNKFYVVVNNTSQTITMSASGGSQSLNIPANVTAQCYCDASNVSGNGAGFYSAQTGSAGNFFVNGTLTASGESDTGNLSVGGNLSVTGTTALTGVATAPTVTPSTDSSTKIATTAFVQSAATAAAQAAYPVGSIYMNASNSTTPATLLGFGSWSALGAGQMLLGAGTNSGNTFTAGSSGGNYAPQLLSHTHSATFTGNALGAHSHTLSYGPNGGGGLGGGDLNSTAGPTSTSSVSAGTPSGSVSVANASSGDQTLGNLPPYLTVYMWQRTA